MDFSDPVPDRQAVDIFLVLAVAESAFEGDELTLLQCLGEFGEIAPGEDAVPFGAVFVVALVVLPALLGCDVENDELSVVLRCFCLCVLSEAANENDLVEHGVIVFLTMDPFISKEQKLFEFCLILDIAGSAVIANYSSNREERVNYLLSLRGAGYRPLNDDGGHRQF